MISLSAPLLAASPLLCYFRSSGRVPHVHLYLSQHCPQETAPLRGAEDGHGSAPRSYTWSLGVLCASILTHRQPRVILRGVEAGCIVCVLPLLPGICIPSWGPRLPLTCCVLRSTCDSADLQVTVSI